MASLDIAKLTVREVKLIQEMTGQPFGQTIKSFKSGEPDAEALHAMALIHLRRENPKATAEDALDAEIFPIFNDESEEEPTDPS